MQANGTLGLIATNTVAQGDTREVGLDAMVADGFTITRAIQSRSWPAASANLEYAAVWGTLGTTSPTTCHVSPTTSRFGGSARCSSRQAACEGIPFRLAENTGIAFMAAYVLGMGFVLDPDEAQEWIAADPATLRCSSPTSTARTSTLDPTPPRPDGSSTSTTGRRDEPRRYTLPFAACAEAGEARANALITGRSHR